MTVPDRIERIEILPVTRERVWEALTTPEQLSRWFISIAEMDFRVGGEITFLWENERSPYPGTIEAIEPLHRFAFRWYPYEIGHPELHLPPATSTLIDFTLDEVAEGTRLTLVESGFTALSETLAPQTYHDNVGGWQEVLTALQTYLQNPVQAS